MLNNHLFTRLLIFFGIFNVVFFSKKIVVGCFGIFWNVHGFCVEHRKYMHSASVWVLFFLNILYFSDNESNPQIRKPRVKMILEHLFPWA